ncbi:hypothetical protein GGF49_006248, partial [Coemansia sp. RSA 1853]
MGEISISGWYSKVCEELEVEEVSGIEVTDLEYTFDPVHAILIEKVYVEKYGKEEWIRVTKEAPSKVREFSIMVKLFLTSEEKGLAYMFKNHTWRLLPTQSKIKKYAEALSLSDLVHHLKSDIITELMNQKNESDEKEVVNVGTLKELTVIPFESKFTLKKDEVDEENNIYLMDPKFIKDVKSLAPAFMELLLEYYDRYRKLGKLPDCPEVMQATEDLKKNNSPAS